jgi:phenylalanyl-tRNA synthetase beta chain
MIRDASQSMCIAGVFGGLSSGVTQATTRIFLESAFFDPATIRKTSFRHNLRTDAATRFEKGIDISQTVVVLNRAAALISEIAGGSIASGVTDIYPVPYGSKTITVTDAYIRKLSGKAFDLSVSASILRNLGFGVNGGDSELAVEVPAHKRDVSYPADIVEEILRIDGLDNIPIPRAITITPSASGASHEEKLREKIANALVGMGFTEILTNSITNSKYFGAEKGAAAVKLLNNLSVELDVLRPAMLPTALEVIAFNHNRRSVNLKLFEWGKTYSSGGVGAYNEKVHLCLYVTGNTTEGSWDQKATAAHIYYLKGVVDGLLKLVDADVLVEQLDGGNYLKDRLRGTFEEKEVFTAGQVAEATAAPFDIRLPIFFANFKWDVLVAAASRKKVWYAEVARFPAMERDLAVVVQQDTRFDTISKAVSGLQLDKLTDVRLFDVFESEKLGAGKKSMAVNFTFLDREKTLTDKEVDLFMATIIKALEQTAGAEIRK